MALDTAIISGASEGIGAAFSKILIKHGWEVIGISRSEKKLNQLKKTIKINPDLFKMSGNKTRKNRETPVMALNPLVSPSNLKNKLLKRIEVLDSFSFSRFYEESFDIGLD